MSSASPQLAVQAGGVIKVFDWPGMQPDARLQVFGVDFHVHSTMLRIHSAFFRKFLDSIDKQPPAPGALFKYDYITKIEEDGTWVLVPFAETSETGESMNGAQPAAKRQRTGQRAPPHVSKQRRLVLHRRAYQCLYSQREVHLSRPTNSRGRKSSRKRGLAIC